MSSLCQYSSNSECFEEKVQREKRKIESNQGIAQI
jgi:hypothetical protein